MPTSTESTLNEKTTTKKNTALEKHAVEFVYSLKMRQRL